MVKFICYDRYMKTFTQQSRSRKKKLYDFEKSVNIDKLLAGNPKKECQ